MLYMCVQHAYVPLPSSHFVSSSFISVLFMFWSEVVQPEEMEPLTQQRSTTKGNIYSFASFALSTIAALWILSLVFPITGLFQMYSSLSWMRTSCNVTGQPYVYSTYKAGAYKAGGRVAWAFYQVGVPVAYKAYNGHNRRVSRATLHAIAHRYACEFCEWDESIAEGYAASLWIGEQVDCWYNHKQPTAVRLCADLPFAYMFIFWLQFVSSLCFSVGTVVLFLMNAARRWGSS